MLKIQVWNNKPRSNAHFFFCLILQKVNYNSLYSSLSACKKRWRDHHALICVCMWMHMHVRQRAHLCIHVWEPPTKQFYPKCQSPRVLPSSQSMLRIAAPSCIGSRPASRQRIRDAHPERQSEWSSNSTQRNIKWRHASIATLLLPASRYPSDSHSASVASRPLGRTSLTARQRQPRFSFRPERQWQPLFIKPSAETARFKANTNVSVCAWFYTCKPTPPEFLISLGNLVRSLCHQVYSNLEIFNFLQHAVLTWLVPLGI
jgi:hypothetical protein